MEQMVLVRRVLDSGDAEVTVVRQSACSGDCHRCAGCGAATETLILRAKNPINAKAGDVVKIESDSTPVLKAAALLYLFPLALFLIGYLLGEHFWERGILISLLGFALGMLPLRPLDRWIKGKMEYTIVDFVGASPAEKNR